MFVFIKQTTLNQVNVELDMVSGKQRKSLSLKAKKTERKAKWEFWRIVFENTLRNTAKD